MMSLVMTPPRVSIPRDRGVTSRSRMSFTEPLSTPPCDGKTQNKEEKIQRDENRIIAGQLIAGQPTCDTTTNKMQNRGQTTQPVEAKQTHGATASTPPPRCIERPQSANTRSRHMPPYCCTRQRATRGVTLFEGVSHVTGSSLTPVADAAGKNTAEKFGCGGKGKALPGSPAPPIEPIYLRVIYSKFSCRHFSRKRYLPSTSVNANVSAVECNTTQRVAPKHKTRVRCEGKQHHPFAAINLPGLRPPWRQPRRG